MCLWLDSVRMLQQQKFTIKQRMNRTHTHTGICHSQKAIKCQSIKVVFMTLLRIFDYVKFFARCNPIFALESVSIRHSNVHACILSFQFYWCIRARSYTSLRRRQRPKPIRNMKLKQKSIIKSHHRKLSGIYCCKRFQKLWRRRQRCRPTKRPTCWFFSLSSSIICMCAVLPFGRWLERK